jgi:hypothetical protein
VVLSGDLVVLTALDQTLADFGPASGDVDLARADCAAGLVDPVLLDRDRQLLWLAALSVTRRRLVAELGLAEVGRGEMTTALAEGCAAGVSRARAGWWLGLLLEELAGAWTRFAK